MKKTNPDWIGTGFDMWMLGMDAASVIWLRSIRIGMGGAVAQREARRMVEEKVAANVALGLDLMTGALGTTAQSVASKSVGHYHKRVRANRKRLSRSR